MLPPRFPKLVQLFPFVGAVLFPHTATTTPTTMVNACICMYVKRKIEIQLAFVWDFHFLSILFHSFHSVVFMCIFSRYFHLSFKLFSLWSFDQRYNFLFVSYVCTYRKNSLLFSTSPYNVCNTYKVIETLKIKTAKIISKSEKAQCFQTEMSTWRLWRYLTSKKTLFKGVRENSPKD